MKKIVALLLIVTLGVFTLAGCSGESNTTDTQENVKSVEKANENADLVKADENKGAEVTAKAKEDIVIGLSMKTLGGPYFKAQEVGAKKAAEAAGIKIFTADGNDDMTKQLADVEDLLARGIDVLILNPLDPKGLVPAAKAAEAAGVPVIIIDSSIDESAPYLTNILSDNLLNGMMVGEYLGSELGKTEGKVAVISGAQGNPVGEERRSGVLRGLTEYQLRTFSETNYEIVAQGWGNWNNEGGLQAMEDILVAHPDVNVVVTENDSMALGAMKAINEAGRTDILIAAAADGQKEAYVEIAKDGNYLATGLNDPELIAGLAVQISVDLMTGKTKPADYQKVTFTPEACITVDNVEEFYNPDSTF